MNEQRTKTVLDQKTLEGLFLNMAEGCALIEVVPDERGVPLDYRCLDVNPSFERLTGLSRERVLGKRVTEALPGFDLSWAEPSVRQALTRGSSRYEGYVPPPLDRTYQAYAYRTAPLRFALVFTDITEKLGVETRVKEVADRYSTLFNATSDGIWINDLSGNILEVNDAYCRMSGYSRDELVGMPISRLEAAETSDEVMAHLRTLLAEGGYERFESRHRRKDGSFCDVDVTALHFAGKEGGRIAIFARDITRRKQSEQRLKESQSLLDAVIDTIPDAIYAKDSSGRLVLLNPAALKSVGKPADQILGKGDREFYDDPAVAEAILENDRRVMTSGVAESFEERLLTPEGYRSYLDTKAPWRDPDGNVIGIIGLSRDITERKRIESELNKKTIELESLFNNSNAGLVLFDAEPPYRVLAHNRYYQELFAEPFHSRGMVGLSVYEYAPAPEAQGIIAALEEVIRTARPRDYVDFPYNTQPPDQTWFNWHLSPVIREGKVVALASMSLNVTERHKAEEAVREQAQLLDMSTEAIFAWEIEAGIQYWNEGARELYGYSREEALGKISHELLKTVHAQGMATFLAELERDGRWQGELTHRTKDGCLVTVESHQQMVRRGDRRLFLETNRDITERKRAEEALRRAKDELENTVAERTAELRKAVEQLREENQERLRNEQALRLEETRLDALWHMSQISESPLPEITGYTLEQAIALTRSEIGFLGFLNEDETIYTLHAVSKDVVKECKVTGDPMQWHLAEAGIWAEAVRQRRTLVVNDYGRPHPRKKGFPPGHPYIGKLMVVPIFEGRRIVALAGVGNKASDYDTSDERQIALLLAGMWTCVQRNEARTVIEKANAQLQEKVEQRTASLRQSEARLARAEEMAHLGSWELDPVANRIVWTDEVYRIFGLRPQEFGATYEAFLEAIHPDDRARVDEFYSDSVREGRDDLGIDYRIVRRDSGEVRFVQTRFENRRDASGLVVRSSGTIQDVTERTRAAALRQALAEQERLRLGAAVEQASDAVVMLDLDGTIRYVNAAFEAINSRSREEVVGTSYFDFLGPDETARAARQAVAQGRAWHGQVTRTVGRGRQVDVEVTISPAADPSDHVVGGLVTEKDVTRESALERQVRQSQKMEALGTLAGGITHDFNNILGAIIINSELALLDLETQSPIRRPLSLVLQAANRGKELVKQIITFSRQREWERRPIEVGSVVREAVKFLSATLPKNVVLKESISPDSGTILGDPSQVHQIVVNLSSNAALAMQERGGTLTVRVEPVTIDTNMIIRHPELSLGRYVLLTVADTGCGMTREVMERIYEPFFTTRPRGQGSGLGLPVVHGITRAYNGLVTVTSEVGRGSVFRVFLPTIEARPEEVGEEGGLEPAGQSARILLVEDETAQRSSLTRSLKKLGFNVTARASGRAALAVFRKDPKAVDLVITDQLMPGMTGLELAGALAKIRPDLPIILCTGFSEQVDSGTVGQNGVRDLIMKPFTLQDITRLIAKALKDKGGKA
jgi:PAS domain S-box-containing protein